MFNLLFYSHGRDGYGEKIIINRRNFLIICIILDLLDVGGGILLIDGLCGDSSPPPDWLHNVGG